MLPWKNWSWITISSEGVAYSIGESKPYIVINWRLDVAEKILEYKPNEMIILDASNETPSCNPFPGAYNCKTKVC